MKTAKKTAKPRSKATPTRAELVGALKQLAAWATGSDRTGNPYCKEPIKNALAVLDRAQGGTGDWQTARTS